MRANNTVAYSFRGKLRMRNAAFGDARVRLDADVGILPFANEGRTKIYNYEERDGQEVPRHDDKTAVAAVVWTHR